MKYSWHANPHTAQVAIVSRSITGTGISMLVASLGSSPAMCSKIKARSAAECEKSPTHPVKIHRHSIQSVRPCHRWAFKPVTHRRMPVAARTTCITTQCDRCHTSADAAADPPEDPPEHDQDSRGCEWFDRLNFCRRAHGKFIGIGLAKHDNTSMHQRCTLVGSGGRDKILEHGASHRAADVCQRQDVFHRDG